MERLVVKSKAGSLYYNDTEQGVKLEPHEITPHQRRLLLERLHVYEDTGLTPEQIRELKERDTAKAPKHAPTGYGMICPICGNLVQVWQKHCGWCGQKLREDSQ